MERVYRVGTRKSPLALKQVEEILSAFRINCFSIITIDTRGDRDRYTPISEMEGSDFFTREIDEALINEEIDFAVHSAKDLPDRLRDGLTVAVKTKSIDLYDALVSKGNIKLDKLRKDARIGTSSLRRKAGLREYRKDFKIIDIRGNIEERLELLDKTDLDGIVIAAAGLIRLGLEERIIQKIPFEIITPHPMQGRLAVIVRENDEETKSLFSRSGYES